MEQAKKQILVFGDVQGKLDDVFKKVQVVNKNKAFSFVLCLGKFFGGNDDCLEAYKKGEKAAPLPTYFCASPEDEKLLDSHIVISGGEVCHNIFCLGRLEVKNIEGITVATCNYTITSPIKSSDPEVSQFLSKYDSQTSFSGVDILVTNEWPKGLLQGLSQDQCPESGLSMLEYDKFGSNLVTHVASTMVPRYHFAVASTKQIFYKRLPYQNGKQFDNGRTYHITRFISLAAAFNAQKKQFMFGIAIAPLSTMDLQELHEIPPDATAFPFKDHIIQDSAAKRQKKRDLERYAASILDGENARPAYAQRKTNQNRNNPLVSGARKDECWFCMSSTVCEIHMIITIDTYFYLAVAKGPLNSSHMLLIPVKHVGNVLQLTQPAIAELWNWKKIISEYFAAQGEIVVFYEHNQPPFRSPHLQHLHIQVVALPKLHEKSLLNHFEHEASDVGVTWNEVDITQDNVQGQLRAVTANAPYFWAHLPNGKHWVAVIEGDIRFPFSFGRRVIARVMGQERLEDWKQCVQSKNEEEDLAKELREALTPYTKK